MIMKNTTLLDFVGTALVVGGLALWCVPAALVVAGVSCLLASWQAGR